MSRSTSERMLQVIPDDVDLAPASPAAWATAGLYGGDAGAAYAGGGGCPTGADGGYEAGAHAGCAGGGG